MCKLKKKRLLATLGLAFGLMTAAGTAQAGIYDKDINLTVKAFNGSNSTVYDTAVTNGGLIHLHVYSVGGDYTVDARARTKGGDTSKWVRRVGDNHTVQWTSRYGAGVEEQIQFSNNLLTPVEVRIIGFFRNN